MGLEIIWILDYENRFDYVGEWREGNFWEGIVYDAEDSDNIIDPYSEGVSAFFESGGK